MTEEYGKLKAKFQEFLEKEFPDMVDKSENDVVKALKVGFEAGALAGVDLFLEFYNEDEE